MYVNAKKQPYDCGWRGAGHAHCRLHRDRHSNRLHGRGGSYGCAKGSMIMGNAMKCEAISQAETDDDIPTFEVSDEALERAAIAEPNALTWMPCTHLPYDCGWPQ